MAEGRYVLCHLELYGKVMSIFLIKTDDFLNNINKARKKMRKIRLME